MPNVVMDAADASWYKPVIRRFASNGVVKITQVGEDSYRMTWKGPTWNQIIDKLEEEEGN